MSGYRPLIINLKAPEISPRINMNDPNFHELTSAEKLNDSDYRSEIYYTFPNEPICGCKKYTNASKIDATDISGNFLVCQSGCMNECCNSRIQRSVTRNEDNANDDKVVGYREKGINKIHNGSRCCGKRMRGGGCEDIYRRREKQADPRNQNQMENECAYRSIDDFESPNYYYSTRSDKKENYQENGRQDVCTMKPCTGADCLIRAFEQTKEFVDSLGKVPGLAGLGLADSMESPYFKMKERSEDFEQVLVSKPTKLKHHHPQQVHEKFPSKIIETKPFTLPSSSRRESMRRPVFSSDYSFLNGEKKSEVSLSEGFGPCGQTCCRSRRKIPVAPDCLNENPKLLKGKEGSRKSHKTKQLRKHKSRNKITSTGGNEKPSRGRIRWVYLAGDSYPGVSFGHKNCNDPRRRVPANMGWLWNEGKTIGRLKPRIGWRPGKISRTLKEIIKEIRAGALEDSRSRSAHSRGTRSMKSRSQTSLKKTLSKKLDEEDATEPPPTLHILRRDGTYYVTMYPVKQENMDVPKLLEPMKPLQFKIVKDKDNSSEISSSTASDIEIEFSPPAAVNRYRKKPDVVHVDTQVKQQEILDSFKPAVEKKEKKGKKGKK